jgi:aminomethyltransferase
VLRRLTPHDIGALPYYHVAETTVDHVPATLASTGYTGERGYELSFDAMHAPRLWNVIADAGREAGVIPCGLGARDTLRLEAAMPLYSHELTVDVNPLEAGLERVVRFEKGEFVGAAALREAQTRGPSRRLVGIELTDRGVPRPDYPIIVDGSVVGALTSGGPSPTLRKSIGLGYVPAAVAAEGTVVAVGIRGQAHAARIVRLPFYRRPRKKSGS